MARQLHKRFSDEEVKMLLKKYINEKVERSYLLEILGIKRRRFLSCLKSTKGIRQGFLFSMKGKRKLEGQVNR